MKFKSIRQTQFHCEKIFEAMLTFIIFKIELVSYLIKNEIKLEIQQKKDVEVNDVIWDNVRQEVYGEER